MLRSIKFAACITLLILVSVAHAQIPQTMSYQGILTDGSGVNVPDGNYNLTFKLYDVASGANPAIWSEGQLVQVNKGVFNVMLGSVNPLSLPFDKQYWLGIAVGLNPELTPRVQLASAAYSLNTRSIANGQVVKSLNGLTDAVTLTGAGGATVSASGNNITITASGGGTGIQGMQNTNNTLDITNPNGPTATVNVRNQGISTAQLADNAVTGAKIASGQAVKSINTLHDDVTLNAGTNVTITPSGNTLTIAATGGGGGLTAVSHNASLSGDGTGGNPLMIATNGVGTTQIADGTIIGGDIADGTIGVGKLSFTPLSRPLSPGVATAEIADNAVTGAKIPTGQVVKSINTIRDDVTLAAGTNVTITPSGSTLTIAATGGGGGLTSVAHNATLSGDGTGGSPLSVSMPLSLGIASPSSVLTLNNSGSGNGLHANSMSGHGIWGETADALKSGVVGFSPGTGVWGESSAGGDGVFGTSSSGTGINGYSNSGTGVNGYSASGIGVHATTISGTAGVKGECNSTGNDVYGVIGTLTAANTGKYSAGVQGICNSTMLLNQGVYGYNAGAGAGVFGQSTSGAGLNGQSSSGTGVYAYSTSGNALEVAGPIKVSGANKAAFVWTTSAGNINGNHTILSYTGMSVTDILIVTHNYQSNYLGNNSVGVWWNGGAWTIYIENGAPPAMPVGEKFNVLVIKQ